jgi:hypothetical protein
MTEKHLVTCPRCGFHVADQGDAANPGLTGDIRQFTHTCQHTADVLNSPSQQPFGCPELLNAVHDAAPIGEAGFEITNGGEQGVKKAKPE